VPHRFKKNASELIRIFDKKGEELTYNSNGTLFIDQVAIPNSNIFELFPLLFKRSAWPKTPGLFDFFQKLTEMGLSHLVVLKNFKKKNETYSVPFSDTESNYWYLGNA
jgi:hypothetical protein